MLQRRTACNEVQMGNSDPQTHAVYRDKGLECRAQFYLGVWICLKQGCMYSTTHIISTWFRVQGLGFLSPSVDIATRKVGPEQFTMCLLGPLGGRV